MYPHLDKRPTLERESMQMLHGQFIKSAVIMGSAKAIRYSDEFRVLTAHKAADDVSSSLRGRYSTEHRSAPTVSLKVSEDIKLGGAEKDLHFESFKRDLSLLASTGTQIVTYNFKPVFDTLYTHIIYSENGAVRTYDPIAFAVFDIFILKRAGADQCYSDYYCHAARIFNSRLTSAQKEALQINIFNCVQDLRLKSREGLLEAVDAYSKLSSDELIMNHLAFQAEIFPVAKKLGITIVLTKDTQNINPLNLPAAY